jgi:hypothetical protein
LDAAVHTLIEALDREPSGKLLQLDKTAKNSLNNKSLWFGFNLRESVQRRAYKHNNNTAEPVSNWLAVFFVQRTRSKGRS